MVVTVLDLAVLRHPELFNRWNRTYSRLHRAARRACRAPRDRDLGVHEARARRAPRRRPGHVTVIGVPPFGGLSPDGPSADGDYVLAVGTLEPRKNLERAAEAASLAGVELRVVGARGWGGVSPNGVRWLGEVGDDELARLLRGARALVYPSLYEGFGIPILEAMSVGTPVVTSRGGATEEVAGGAAVLVDPLDPASIAAGIDDADRRRDELRALGLARARSFSWDDVGPANRRGVRGGAVIVVDADVLGRDRTGDETYVANLLQALADLKGDLRIAAITRDASLVPAGIEPLVLTAGSQELRMAWSVPRLLRRVRPRLVHFVHALPLRLTVRRCSPCRT